MLYQAKKPVHWCMSDKTALAEAEIEYDEEHTSPSIYVKFATPEAGLFAVIWTTTPWTLPANWAIAYHPTFDYVTVRANGERYIVAKDLADKVVEACKLVEDGPREPFAVEELRAAPRRAPSVPRSPVALLARRLRHARAGHGPRAHRARPRRRRLRHRQEVRPARRRARRRRRQVHRRPVEGRVRVQGEPEDRRAPGRDAARCSRRRSCRSRTRTRSAGAARTRSSSAPPSSCSRAWTARPTCARPRSPRSAARAGSRRGARTASRR